MSEIEEIKKTKEDQISKTEETDSLFCKIHNQILIRRNEKLYCNQCNKYFNYKGPAKKVSRQANPLREIKVPKKVVANN